MIDTSLVSLLHLCDSLFPTGAYAHSDGLEAAVADGRATTREDLAAWLDACLDHSIAACDGPAIVQVLSAFGRRQWEDIAVVNEELYALRPSAASRRAATSMGRRLLVSWRAARPEHAETLACATGESLDMTLPVSFALVCGCVQVAPRTAVEAYAYTRLAAAASCAMRLMPVGQSDAHRLVAETLARVPGVAADAERGVREGWRPGSFTPMMDIAQMRHAHVHSRLFLS